MMGLYGWMVAARDVHGDGYLLRDSETREARVYLGERQAQAEADTLNAETEGGYYAARVSLYLMNPALQAQGGELVSLEEIAYRAASPTFTKPTHPLYAEVYVTFPEEQ